MNNQRNNNRRRGRGNNRGGGNGGNQGNRIDSRARGNAPQLLEKYRKLAHEASLNDDRVQTEYYLQFADHYFRVIADGRAQKDEGRPQRRDAEQQGYDGEDYEDEREDYRDAPRDGGRESGRDAGRDSGRDERARDDRGGRQQQRRQERDADDAERAADTPFEVRPGAEGDEDDGENPFAAKSRRNKRGPARRKASDEDEIGLDPGLLPPAIGRASRDDDDDRGGRDADDAAPAAPADDEAPAAEKPRRRLKMPRSRSGDEEELEAVN